MEKRLERKLESIATRIESKQAKSESATAGVSAGSVPITQANLSRSLTEVHKQLLKLNIYGIISLAYHTHTESLDFSLILIFLGM